MEIPDLGYRCKIPLLKKNLKTVLAATVIQFWTDLIGLLSCPGSGPVETCIPNKVGPWKPWWQLWCCCLLSLQLFRLNWKTVCGNMGWRSLGNVVNKEKL